MRILLVNSYYAPDIRGGAETWVKALAEELHRQGHQCAVLCTGSRASEEILDGVTVFRRPTKKFLRGREYGECGKLVKAIDRVQELWCRANRKTLEAVIAAYQPEVIHTNNLYEITPVIWQIARSRRIKVVHTLHDYYLLCPRVSLACRDRKQGCAAPHLLCRIHRRINRASSKLVHSFTAPSEWVLDTFRRGGFFPGGNGVVIPNGVALSPEETANALRIRKNREPGQPVRYVYLGTLTEQKGIHLLLEAFGKLPPGSASLSIAGRGELEPLVRQYAARNPAMEYCGFLEERDVRELLLRSDVLICPSVWEEPFGMVVLEAYRQAMPVIASRKGALPELIRHQETGMLVDIREKDGLLEAMRFYTEQPSRIYEHGRNAAAALEAFSVKRQAERFAALYRS